MATAHLLRGLVGMAIACAALGATPAMAQSDESLAAARKTFAEGVSDENAKHYAAALERFRSVAAVKETANVRYRIASCLEALGRRAEALVSYETAVRIGAGDPTATDTVRESRERAAELDRTVPRLVLTFSTPPPPGTEVRVDDAPVDPAALRDPIRLDPGPHAIAAAAPVTTPFRTTMALLEGSQVTLVIDLPSPPSANSKVPLSRAAEASGSPSAPADPLAPRRSAPLGGYVALGLGGALAVGSVVSFVLRASNVATLNRECNSLNGDAGTLHCPLAHEGELNGAHNAAVVEGPLGIGLGLGAAVAAGLGLWFTVSPPSRDGVPAVARAGLLFGPMLVPHGGGIVLSDSL